MCAIGAFGRSAAVILVMAASPVRADDVSGSPAPASSPCEHIEGLRDTAAALPSGAERRAVLRVIASCHETRSELAQAWLAYRAWLDDAPPDAAGREEIVALADALDRLLATIAIDTHEVPVDVYIDDTYLGRGPGTLRATAGRHEIRLVADGYGAVTRTLDLAPRATTDVDETLVPVAPRGASNPVPRGVTYLTFALATTATVGAILFGAFALDRSGTINSRLASPDESIRSLVRLEDINAARGLASAADVVGVVGVVFWAATAILFPFTEWGDAPTSDDAPRVTFEPSRLAIRF